MANKSKSFTKQKDDNIELQFHFENVQLFVVTNPDIYNDEDSSKIDEIVQHMSRSIWIDKSYVDFPENKHQDTFLELDGWNKLCSLIKKTKYGKESAGIADDIIVQSLKLMVIAYMYSVLESFGYDIEGIAIDFMHNYRLDVKYYIDTVQEWKYYPGPWQDWGLDDSEQYPKNMI